MRMVEPGGGTYVPRKTTELVSARSCQPVTSSFGMTVVVMPSDHFIHPKADFIALAEREAGRDLTDLFDRWLHQDGFHPFPP